MEQNKPIVFTIYKGTKDGRIVESTVQRDALSGEEVLVKITHSSLCATDELFKQADICLGHEGAGHVEALGPAVTGLRIGDNVGFGFQHGSCGSCQQCLQGLETYCPHSIMYGAAEFDTGSMASHAVFRASSLYQIPTGMSNEAASAFMCGGAAVFNVFDMYNVKPTERVGIVGMGGAGHLAIQFAVKWGCEVVVFSGTESKREEAMRLGASKFCHVARQQQDGSLVEPTEIKLATPIDRLLVTSNVQVPWALYLPIMARPGAIYPLCVDQGDLTIPFMPFLTSGLSIQASIIAPRAIHRRMLRFAAFHNINPIVKQYDWIGVKEPC